ncbi:amidase [Cupriavidus sp. WS]|uniref:amidase n=1 Tax=Cupriavidus sp. WS TaxID=1312922 RepID=UPI0003633501|nr:amidase family protein [Cupriavidus sp. WS]
MTAELAELTAPELRSMILARRISPVEVLRSCIRRIEAVNPYVNAVTATCFERAGTQARAAERALGAGKPVGLLHGLPMGVKDLEETQGLLTTYGSPLYRGNLPPRDNVLVSRLRAAGAILVGKTNVPEFGAGANTRNPVWGATGNPFDPRLNAGGSSGGSAAALACDMLPVCTGSDTGGSLRIPAAKCGVVGMRPSPGLVPSERRLLGWSALSVVGPMGRTVAEAALQLAATVGLCDADPLSQDAQPHGLLNLRAADLATLRVGFTEDFGACEVDDGIRATFRERIARIAGLFASCEPVGFAGEPLGEVHRCFDIMRSQAFVAAMRGAYENDPASIGPNARANYELGAAFSLADAAWAHAEQTRIFRAFQRLYSRFDVILAPTTPVSPFPWTRPHAEAINGKPLPNYYRWLDLTYIVTLATNPALSLPCGLDRQGLPFGLQVIAPFRRDLRLLEIASALESAFSADTVLRRPRPDLAALKTSAAALRSIVTHPPLTDAAPAGAPVSVV